MYNARAEPLFNLSIVLFLRFVLALVAFMVFLNFLYHYLELATCEIGYIECILEEQLNIIWLLVEKGCGF